MKPRRAGLVFSVVAFALPVMCADTLEDVLTRMDRAAKDFKSFSANIARKDYQNVLDESTTSEGVVRMQRTKDEYTGLMVFSGADAQTAFFEGRTGGVYHPKANTVEIYDGGKQAASLEQIILLGFGTSKAELTKSYDIKMGGADRAGGDPTTRIELTPKSKDLKSMVARIELWIPEDKGYPIQEKITEPSKNYKLVTYSDMKLPAPPNSSFKPALPADVKKIYPQR